MSEDVTVYYMPEREKKEPTNKEYLGDSVYVGQDADWPAMLLLTTENGMPGDPSNRIGLEPDVLAALIRYAKARGIVK